MAERVRLKGRTIGVYDANTKTYRAIRHFPRDVARKFQAYGIDANAVQDLAAQGCETVQIEERRGESIRLYTFPFEVWQDARVDTLGGTGLSHNFVPFTAFPKAEILRHESCGRRLPCCSKGRCRARSGHWKEKEAHECNACHTRTQP